MLTPWDLMLNWLSSFDRQVEIDMDIDIEIREIAELFRGFPIQIPSEGFDGLEFKLLPIRIQGIQGIPDLGSKVVPIKDPRGI